MNRSVYAYIKEWDINVVCKQHDIDVFIDNIFRFYIKNNHDVICELFSEYDVYCDVVFDGGIRKMKIRDVIGRKISDFTGVQIKEVIYKREVFE